MGFPGTGQDLDERRRWLNWADARIHIASHVIHYGSGVFEGARCYDTPKGAACFRLGPHMRRLFDSARVYRMECRFGQAELEGAVLETIRANRFQACYIRPLLYRGYATLGVNPLPCPVDAAVMLWEWGAYLGAGAIESGVDVCVTSWTRTAPNTLPALAKSCANYANAALIKMEATVEGYAEGISLDTGGHLAEGSAANLFLVRDSVIYTPPVSASVLPGITRASVITIARDLVLCPRGDAAAGDGLYRRRGLLHGHGRRNHADPLDRQDSRGRRHARPRHGCTAARLLRHHQRRDPRYARLADLRVSRQRRGARRGGRPRRRGLRS